MQTPSNVQRTHEAALRQLEQRISVKMLLYLRDVAQRAAAEAAPA
jgi:hypothetical protein